MRRLLKQVEDHRDPLAIRALWRVVVEEDRSVININQTTKI